MTGSATLETSPALGVVQQRNGLRCAIRCVVVRSRWHLIAVTINGTIDNHQP
jgi:hypothetical protein